MKKFYFSLILIIFFLTTCEDRERANPQDPETKLDPSEWASSNLQAEVVNELHDQFISDVATERSISLKEMGNFLTGFVSRVAICTKKVFSKAKNC